MSPVAVLEQELAACSRETRSGILAIVDGKVRRLFCLRKGILVHAASNIVEEQFDEFLVREGHLRAADRARSRLESAKAGISPLAWIAAQELIPQATLAAAIAEHATALLRSGFEARSAETDFTQGTPNLADKPVTELPLDRLLLDFLQDHPKSSQEVRVRLGRPGLLPVRVVAKQDLVLSLATTHPIVGEVWRLADGDVSVSQLVDHVEGGEDVALRALYALTLLGAIESVAPGGKVRTSPRKVPVTRTELLARLDRAIDANHYGILDLTPGADAERVRHAYYSLAQRYHPDRFRSGDHEDLLPRIEAYFAQVTEAYNTLSDSSARRLYEQEIAAAASGRHGQGEPMHDAAYLARQNFLRAKVVLKRNQFQQAVTFLENAIQLEENVAEYHVELGTVLTRNPRRRDEAEEHLRRGVQLDPTAAAGHVALIDLMLKRERPDEARRVLEEAFKWIPDHPELAQRAKLLGDEKGRGLFRR